MKRSLMLLLLFLLQLLVLHIVSEPYAPTPSVDEPAVLESATSDS